MFLNILFGLDLMCLLLRVKIDLISIFLIGLHLGTNKEFRLKILGFFKSNSEDQKKKQDSLVNHFKEKFDNKSNSELEEIINSSGYSLEAKQATQLLLTNNTVIK